LAAPLADNQSDPHYRLTFGGSTAYAATAAGAFPIPPWLGNNSMSAWISPSPDTLGLSDGLGTYNYRYETRFNLTGFNPATARLSGRWATDNRGVDILINGISTGQSNTAQFPQWTSFQITSGFVPGTNRLTFVVNNGSPGIPEDLDPTGLRAEVWGAALLDCASAHPAPYFQINRQNDNVVLTWQQPGFLLQGAPNVTGPWANLTRGMSFNGVNFSASMPFAGPHRFFRLRLDCD
jgi:hypothetical protein